MNEGSDNKQIRWALLCNSLQLKKWQVEVIKQINDLNYCELCLVIVNVNKEKTPGFYNKILHYPYTNFLFRIYKRFFLKLKAEEYIDLSEELKKLPQINCKTFKRGIYSEYFYKEDIEQIKEYKLDFILRFGFNIIKGEILESASYGVWSYHHGNPLNYRGGPPAFWEIFKNDNITGVVLQKLTDKLDSGVILKTAYFKTIKHSFSANLDNILINASYMVKAVCIDLYYEAASYFEDKPLQTNAPIYKYPSNIKTFIFLLKLAVNKIKFHFNDLFIAEQWTAGIIKEKIEKVLYTNKNEINWIENKNRYTYRADVFLCNNKGQTLLVYEKYNYKLQKGNISGLYLNNDLSEGEEITLLEAKTHFAYPYTFQHNDKVYCIPESAGLNKINLYQIDFNTGKMLFIKTLLDNIDAVDSTLFNYKNYWWLFFTRKSQDTNTKLYMIILTGFINLTPIIL